MNPPRLKEARLLAAASGTTESRKAPVRRKNAHPRTRVLSDERAACLKRDMAAGMSFRQLQALYDVSNGTLCQIADGYTYKEIEPAPPDTIGLLRTQLNKRLALLQVLVEKAKDANVGGEAVIYYPRGLHEQIKRLAHITEDDV